MSESYEIAELQALLESDIQTLFKLVFTFGTPVVEGDIRAASAILRRWLVEGLIGQLCGRLQVTPSFPTFDNAEAITLAADDPNVNYFLTAGVKCSGVPIMFVFNSSAPPDGSINFNPPRQILLKTRKFLGQKRVYFNGDFFSCQDIISFTANKLGGVHLDTRRDEKQQRMQQASEFMTFGGPIEKIQRPRKSEIHMSIEENGREMMSGFHIEILAAAASFIQIHLNGDPLAELPKMKKTLRSRLFGNKSPKFHLYVKDKP